MSATLIKSVVREDRRLPEKAHPLAVGIELELEGCPIDLTEEPRRIIGTYDLHPYSKVHKDGSLREGGIEFVTKVLQSDKEIANALRAIDTVVKGLALKDSNRAGVHVHLNVQDLTIDEYWNLVLWYMLLEPAMMQHVGGGRERSIYCRPYHSHLTAMQLLNMHIGLMYSPTRLPRMPHKYYGLNLDSTEKYGTVEFRQMKSTTDMVQIEAWAALIKRFKQMTLANREPAKLGQSFSAVTKVGYELGLRPSSLSLWESIYWNRILPCINSIQSSIELRTKAPTWGTKKKPDETPHAGYAKFMAVREAKVPKKSKSSEEVIDDYVRLTDRIAAYNPGER